MTVSTREATRANIVEAAAHLLRDQGPEAVTTRRVAEQAGVQPPAIYRLFGDKDGLLEAVAERVMTMFVSEKAAIVHAATDEDVDPLEDLHDGWRSQIAFGVANPDLFRLLSDPARVARSPAAQSGRRVLESRVRRIAAAGRLRVSERRAVSMIQAAGTGVIQTLLATTPQDRDSDLPEAMYNAVLAQIIGDAPHAPNDMGLVTAVTLRAIAPELTVLSDAERQLLDDWLERVVNDLATNHTSRTHPTRDTGLPGALHRRTSTATPQRRS